MNIVIFTGGTGSTALQQGINEIYKDKINLTLITNAYDNGLSTGAVRKVMGGNILGPSDVRKNQVLQSTLAHTQYDILKFIEVLNERIDAVDSKDMENKCIKMFNVFFAEFKESVKWSTIRSIVNNSIQSFFSLEDSKLIDYTDFSVANIIYAGIAYRNNFSLSKASKFIASNLLRIPEDRVLLSSDNSLFLQAITENGTRILDEGDIVKWNTPENPIVDIELVDVRNKVVIPELSAECRKAISAADIIIFSSGTQWSSLIPTYKHKFFYESIKNSSAKKYLVMNNIPDKDMVEANSNKILNILSNYLPLEDITTVLNFSASEKMNIMAKTPYIIGRLSDMDSKNNKLVPRKCHDRKKLITFILRDYYKEFIDNKDYFMFDFDDTLVGRRNSYREESIENIKYFQLLGKRGIVVTGNSQNHIETQLIHNKYNLSIDTGNIFYCDGGNSYCMFDKRQFKFIDYMNDEFIINNEELRELYEKLVELGIPIYKLENRNNVVVTIKPFTDEKRLDLIEELKLNIGDKFDINKAGLTSIDICKKGYNKSVIFSADAYKNENLYVGDEIEDGNDSIMKTIKNIKTFPVNNPKETNILLTTLLNGISTE